MEERNESILTSYPNVILFECYKEILNQMENNIGKIKIGKKQGTGFFCKIPFSDKNNMLKVLITNNQLINEDILFKEDENILIYIEKENKIKQLNLNNRIKYTKEEYDITIIEIKEEDEINNFLELDENIINNIINNIDENVEYVDKTCYIMQYPEGELSLSCGIILSIYKDKKYKFKHLCSTKYGSSGSPILTLKNKVIGLHSDNAENFNKGTFLNEPIKDFIRQYNQKNDNNNILNIDLIGPLKLCLLEKISSKLNHEHLMKLPEFILTVIKTLKDVNIRYIRINDNEPKKIIKEVLYRENGNNIINFSDFVEEMVSIGQINKMVNLLNSEDIQKIKDIWSCLAKYNEYLTLFNKDFEKSQKESIFEFSMISLVIIERIDLERFEQERKKCPNRVNKILFHGTIIDPISCILTSNFIIPKRVMQFGQGVYFTDNLDYCWLVGRLMYNRENFDKIASIGDNFTLVACSTYYDKKGLRKVSDNKYTPKKNEINFAYLKTNFEPVINPDFREFVLNEYVINNFDQICPFIGAKLERNEYCIIWYDNNFSSDLLYNNKSQEGFKKYLKEKIKYIKKWIKYNIYQCSTLEEALKLVEKKKYNKIILIANIGINLEGKKFVDESRKIIGNDVIALFLEFNNSNVDWLKNYKNALISDDLNFCEEYLKCFCNNNTEEKIKSLIERVEKYIGIKLSFDNNFIKFPLFKDCGKYSDLTFKI